MHPIRRVLTTLLLLAPLAALVSPARSQTYTIASVVFTHPGPYTNAELLAVSGLAPGQHLGEDTLPTAAHRLLDTGLFSDATINYTGSGKATTIHVDLQPIPLDKLLPTSFENFIWFTPDELTTGIHALVPLYRGVASDAGNLPDAIQSALQQMLTAKGIAATLSHAIVEPTNLHPQLTVDFKVETPTILLAQTNLTGIPDPLKPDTLRAIQRLNGARYNEGRTGTTIEDTLLAPARSAGYLNASLQNIQRSPAPTSNGIAVTYTATFVPGDAYKVSTLTWNPTPIYSAADFARDTRLHPGDPASDSALRATEAPISNAYLLQGYIDVYILPHPTPDPTTHTVAYNLTAVPGDIYHLGAITINGLSPKARALFDADWQLKPGDLYSDLAVNAFLKKHAAQAVFRTYDPTFKAIGDPQTHLVDLTLTFTPNGSKDY
jgi:outer membrane protein assembly factor BamA